MNTPHITADSANPARVTTGAGTPRGMTRAWGGRETRIAETAYVAFLLLIFVGVSPFFVPDTVPGADSTASSGAGDVLRQVSYLAVFGVIAGMAVLRRGWQSFAAMPLSFALLLGFCLLTTFWSIEPEITFRRGVLVSVIAASAMLSVDTIGAKRSLDLLRIVLAGIVIVCWISLPLIPQARHFANDIEQGVAGDWRGLYVHKNIAGAVCAHAALIFLYYAMKSRRPVNAVLFVMAVGFLVGTNSKSSLGLLPLAWLAALAYGFAIRNRLDRQIIVVAAACVTSIVAAVVWVWWTPFVQLLQDPTLFTGRAAIWQAEIAFIRDHPLLGSGFGTFAYTGEHSPIYDYIDAAWVGTVANGHHGYLELLVTIGIPGFVLAICALLVEPVRWFAARSQLDVDTRKLLFALFAFFLMHNFVETNFLRTDGAEWVTFLLAIAMLRTSRANPGTERC
jgi:O-antigen ligase